MKENIKNKNNINLPVVASRGVVAFPKGTVHLEVARQISLDAIQNAIDSDKRIFVVAQKNIEKSAPKMEDLYQVGTVVQIKQFHKYSETEYRLSGVGLFKGELIDYVKGEKSNMATIKRIPERLSIKQSEEEIEALIRSLKRTFVQYTIALKQVNQDVLIAVENENDPFKLFTLICSLTPIPYQNKQELLEEKDLYTRLNMLFKTLTNELSVVEIEREIIERVEQSIDKNQREYFLREQAKVINEELGYGNDPTQEEQEYLSKINKIKNIPDESREKLLNEAKRLAKMPESSHEAYVITNYLDTVVSLPWDKMTKDNLDIKKAQNQLDKDHYGLKKVKERIVENLAVRVFKPDLKGQIICLVGPPGVGKTSVGQSIAKAMGRNFVRISLGGISDESDIRGHRKTYIGAMPGRVISAINQAKSRNPLVLLDEIDKMGSSFKGDPSSAMLEVLDSQQNNTFVDHYIEVPFDLSDCMFITTANSKETIPAPLLDRMEIIDVSSYTLEEKFHICKEHLIPKQLKKHGLNGVKVKFSDDAIYEIIDGYTRESGVRTLERTIASLLRKAAKEFACKSKKSVRFTKENIHEYLGAKKFLGEKIAKEDQVGVVNGLAWTSVGGELMQIEASVMEGKGELELTGNLGDVMKESAKTAVSYVRSVSKDYGIDLDFHKTKDIHIHVPEGAVPKDGPSAGVALATVLVSALTNTPIRHDVAMTGEITLRGRDLAIGGLKEKSIAAYKSGVKTVLIPYDNKSDLEEIDDKVKDSLKFIPCKTASEVLSYALRKKSENSKKVLRKNPKKEDDMVGLGLI